MKSITSTEANRRFSKLLAAAAKGEATAITVRGKVVAKLIPAMSAEQEAEAEARWNELLERLKSQSAQNLPRFKREDLYD
jgi:prevent-host-death family protein